MLRSQQPAEAIRSQPPYFSPSRLVPAGGLNFYIHPGRQTQFIQSLDRSSRRPLNVDQTLVRSDLELLPRFLIYMGARKNRVAFDARWQRNRAVSDGIGPLDRAHNLFGALVEDGVIVGLHPNSNDLFRLSSHRGSPISLPIPVCQRMPPVNGGKPQIVA